MNKRYPYIFLLMLVFLGAFFFLQKELSSGKRMKAGRQSQPSLNNQNPSPLVLKIKGKRVVGLKPGNEKEQIANMKVANSPSNSWEAPLKETLRHQAGANLKEISLNKVDSFVWAQDGIALFVESVIVTLKNKKNETTSFRILVDAQNGKILKNWDQPVIDPINPRDEFRIKIDPRYHGE